MIRISEMLNDGLKKAPAFAVVGGVLGVAVGVSLPLLMLPGFTDAFGMGPVAAFGLLGGLGGAAAGAELGVLLGAVKSFDQQMASQEATAGAGRDVPQISTPELPHPLVQPQQSAQETLVAGNRPGGRGR